MKSNEPVTLLSSLRCSGETYSPFRYCIPLPKKITNNPLVKPLSLQELNDYIEQLHEELEDVHVQFDALSKEHKVGVRIPHDLVP